MPPDPYQPEPGAPDVNYETATLAASGYAKHAQNHAHRASVFRTIAQDHADRARDYAEQAQRHAARAVRGQRITIIAIGFAAAVVIANGVLQVLIRVS